MEYKGQKKFHNNCGMDDILKVARTCRDQDSKLNKIKRECRNLTLFCGHVLKKYKISIVEKSQKNERLRAI